MKDKPCGTLVGERSISNHGAAINGLKQGWRWGETEKMERKYEKNEREGER